MGDDSKAIVCGGRNSINLCLVRLRWPNKGPIINPSQAQPARLIGVVGKLTVVQGRGKRYTSTTRGE